MPGTGWANYFVPLFICNLPQADRTDRYSQYGQYWTSPIFGVGVGCSGIVAVWRAARSAHWVLMLLALSASRWPMGKTALCMVG